MRKYDRSMAREEDLRRGAQSEQMDNVANRIPHVLLFSKAYFFRNVKTLNELYFRARVCLLSKIAISKLDLQESNFPGCARALKFWRGLRPRFAEFSYSILA